jgi:DNA-binding CsgD family transcriptional regulator
MRRIGLDEDRVFRSVRRCCYAGFDSMVLREEVSDRIGKGVPFDAFTFALTDPDTGLLTHAVAEGLPSSLAEAWTRWLYPYEVAGEIIEMARCGPPVATSSSRVVDEVLRPAGLGHHLRTVLSEHQTPWGFLCFLRETRSPAFAEREAALMVRLAPHLLEGIRLAVLLDRAGGMLDPEAGGDEAALGPGVVVIGTNGRIGTKNGAGTAYLRDLADVGELTETVPCAVQSAVAQMAHRHGMESREHAEPLAGELCVQGRSGRWYSIRTSLTEPDVSGASGVIVLIDPARRSELAPLLSRLYGLTKREREVLALAGKGWSTKRISTRLEISPYTVQEHVGNACTKVGVRTRRELLAKLFFDGYAADPHPNGARSSNGHLSG